MKIVKGEEFEVITHDRQQFKLVADNVEGGKVEFTAYEVSTPDDKFSYSLYKDSIKYFMGKNYMRKITE